MPPAGNVLQGRMGRDCESPGRKEAMHFTGLQSSCHRLSSVREKAAGEISLEVGD